MSTITFRQLPRELRDMIWSAAAAVQYHHIGDSSPHSPTAPGAIERLRQAFVGYNNLPQDTEIQPLRLYVNDDGGKLRLRVNEFQTLVNHLPIATVCSEARPHAIDFCRKQVNILDLHYTKDPSNVDHELIEHALRPTTVMVTNMVLEEGLFDGPEDSIRGFNSADHLVAIIDRIFGSCVENLVLNSWCHSAQTLERIYWPHIGRTRDRKDMDYTSIDNPSHARHMVKMTPDRTMHIKAEILNEHDDSRFALKRLSDHLLKFHEILDACQQNRKLPRLQSFELQLHTYCWDEILPTHVKAIANDGVLWVNWSDFKSGFVSDFYHDFFTDYVHEER
ncbi:hypothetical protein P171DRAFT_426216 [Karstenula rhodostoma CBS 690.94]|uniref:2EXR domain-containing protein n=1 Tax=Karstenula rhodostoma CBS 690.94 TaxID=1392251 RepID=A0A9P4UJI9_9PLEO|nr:hypothetical protein P171DRAFT_426216 [Karstenula rhodostoma CBS 690.94]